MAIADVVRRGYGGSIALVSVRGYLATTETILGRRRRTRRYQTPTPEALEQDYVEIAKAAPAEAIRAVIGQFLLRGDTLPIPQAAAVDWAKLVQDTETVVKLFDLYLEYVEDEEVTFMLLGDY